MYKFWIVIPDSKSSTTKKSFDSNRKKFTNLDEAKKEAARRCSKYMIDYIVLESIAICRPATPPV